MKRKPKFSREIYKHDFGGNVCGAEIALVGNPNTGKSCLFNQLTTLDAIVSNYAGTTVDIFEGKTMFGEKIMNVADLPGIYNLGAASEDERVARDYIVEKKPKVIVNVVDATILERNLYLTLQLLELKVPMIVALNFYEELEDKGITIDYQALSMLLGVPVVPIDALRGAGIPELVKTIEAAMQGNVRFEHYQVKYGEQVEGGGPQDTQIARMRHGEAALLAQKVMVRAKAKKSFKDFLDRFTTEPFTGTLSLVVVMSVIFASLFTVGNYLSGLVGKWFDFFVGNPLAPVISAVPTLFLKTIISWGLQGINAGLQIVLPYILVFYLMLGALEDTGYLPRMAYLLDRLMHRMHLHGNAIIPMMLGFGCSVPAVLATRILPNRRDRILTSVLICMIPCSARTAVILGATGKFLGLGCALLIYSIVLILIFAVGYILGKLLPGESTGLIMEMPEYRLPHLSNVWKKTWIRVKDFIWIAFPMIVIGSSLLGVLKAYGLLAMIARPFAPVVEGWLMLPAVAGITLIYGILRKEMALELLFVLGGSASLLKFMTPQQIFTFTLVVALYFPCAGTLAVLKHEFGWKKSLLIASFTVVLAVLAGGIVARI